MGMKKEPMRPVDPVSKVISLYLPERDQAEAIAVREAGFRGKPITTGAMVRELVRLGIAEYWKIRPDTTKKKPKVPAAKKARKKKIQSTHPVGRHPLE